MSRVVCSGKKCQHNWVKRSGYRKQECFWTQTKKARLLWSSIRPAPTSQRWGAPEVAAEVPSTEALHMSFILWMEKRQMSILTSWSGSAMVPRWRSRVTLNTILTQESQVLQPLLWPERHHIPCGNCTMWIHHDWISTVSGKRALISQ